VDRVPDPLLFFLVVPGIEPGSPDLQPRTLITRPQRRSRNAPNESKALLTGRGGPKAGETSRLPHLLDQWPQKNISQ
jgi:hypothetical protein